MSDFTWHLMDEKQPEQRENDYLVMGLRGGLYLSNGYDEKGAFFYLPNHRQKHFMDSKSVLAWAEIPPLEVDE